LKANPSRHEALIASLKFDGKTSGPEAAVAYWLPKNRCAQKRVPIFTAMPPRRLPFAAAPDEAAAALLKTTCRWKINARPPGTAMPQCAASSAPSKPTSRMKKPLAAGRVKQLKNHAAA